LTPEIQVRRFTGIKGLENLKPAWEALFQSCLNPCFYNDWRWHHAVQQHLAPCTVHYFAVYEGENLMGILPLSRNTQRRFGLRIVSLGFPSHPAIDAADLLLRQDKRHIDLIAEVLRHINEQRLFHWDVLDLCHFSTRSGTYALVGSRAAFAQRSAFIERLNRKTLTAALSKKKIKNTRRHRNKAELAYGPVTFTSVRSKENIRAAYGLFLDVEAASWKGPHGAGTAIRLQPRSKDFYEAVLRGFAATGQAQVDILYVAGKPAAAQLGLRSGDCLALLKIGYDEMLKDLGPGAIALLCCLEHENPTTRALSLVTNPAWAKQWHFKTENTWSIAIFNRTLYAQFLRFSRPVYFAIKRLPPKLWPNPRRQGL
jgi:CelD/BcsL family acetyltransferase involved in cellulose biosynthesis